MRLKQQLIFSIRYRGLDIPSRRCRLLDGGAHDLDEGIRAHQSALDCYMGRKGAFEEFPVGFVHGIHILDVGEVDRGIHHLGALETRRLEDAFNSGQRRARLRRGISLVTGVISERPRNKEPVADPDGRTQVGIQQ